MKNTKTDPAKSVEAFENRNNAAMREALLKASDVLTEAAHHNLTEEYINECRALIRDALAAPPRNCDILSEEGANEAWDEYRHSRVLPRGGWDFRHVIALLYADAKEKDGSNG